MTQVTLSPVLDFAALGERWRALEDRADASFFQSWTWTGCLAEERFPDPVLLEAHAAGETVGLALFNRRRGRFGRDTLFLGETGIPAYDRIFIERNGPLVVAGPNADAIAADLLRTARRQQDLVLSGVTDAVLASVGSTGPVLVTGTMPAPFADLTRLRPDGNDFLDHRSANTRQQLRRSDRAYAAQGALTLARAETEAEAHAWLDTMAVLHQVSWATRGEPGCFAQPFFGRFHRELIRRGMRRNEIDLLRICAGEHVIGVLYNFRYRGRALAYQSGFDYSQAGRARKPGLTSHHRAILFSAAQGLRRYDFLAGDDRYKRSLSDGAESLHWVQAAPGWSARFLAARLRTFAARLRFRRDVGR